MESRFTAPDAAFSANELTLDSFLGGAVRIFQPRSGFRAGIDSAMLAAAVPAEPGQSVLELGCGAGASVLCLRARIPGLSAVGLEIMPDYAELARRNSGASGRQLDVVLGSVSDPPAKLKRMSFDHVMANPPFFTADGGLPALDEGRRIARQETAALESWVDCALRRLRPKGWLTMILPPGRFPEFISAIQGRAGSTGVKPLYPKCGRPASRLLIRSRKGAKGVLSLASPLVLHEGPGKYSAAAEAVLRSPAAIEF